MSFVVDADICSAYLKAHPYVSVITVAELTIWECRANAPAKPAQDVQDLLKNVTILEIAGDVARQFGKIQAALMDAGQLAPEMDLLIAATALIHGYTLLTHNTQDYASIPGLIPKDWTIP